MPKCVMIIDDDAEYCDELIPEALRQLRPDLEFLSVGSILQAGAALSQRLACATPPDLIVLDIHLPRVPGMLSLDPRGGVHVLGAVVSAFRPLSPPPVIVFTAWPCEADHTAVRALGAVAYVAKLTEGYRATSAPLNALVTEARPYL